MKKGLCPYEGSTILTDLGGAASPPPLPPYPLSRTSPHTDSRAAANSGDPQRNEIRLPLNGRMRPKDGKKDRQTSSKPWNRIRSRDRDRGR